MDDKAVMTVGEAASLLRLSKSGTYTAIRLGQIPSVRIGRRILIARAAINELLSSGKKLAEHG